MVAPSEAGADVRRFLEDVEADDDLRGALAHRERLVARAASHAAALPEVFAPLAPVLARRGIDALYTHQARALDALERERDVVVSTSTASGKTLVYALGTLLRSLARPDARALYLFPLKALSRDQQRGLEADLAALGRTDLRVAVYDGDTSPHARRKLRDDPPSVLITTPDMLHAGILPHHGLWKRFFERLELVVIDELHTYRGIFGAHVAQVMRRLERVARHHGASPRFVAASATLANPGELAHALTGRRFEVISEDGAPQAARDVLLFRPRGSPYTLAAKLFRASLARGLRTIAFTKARRITELMHSWITEAEPHLAGRISAYRAGFLPEERREIERRLFDGTLSGVISTSALELGIDVGGLDVCILVGYPGSQVATWQRSGRVGRRGDAAIALVAQPDALDQYLVGHPEVFFARAFEHAVLDPHNPEIAGAHLPCAAAELPLAPDEPWLAAPEVRANVARAEEQCTLLRSETGDAWYAARRRPHREVGLRQAGASYAIVATERDGAERLVGSIGAANVFAECHEGAIYLHRGRQYHVSELDLEERTVHVRGVRVPFYTRALSEKETEILEEKRQRPAGSFRLFEGRVRVTTRITGYERRRVHGQDLLGTEPLELPPSRFETTGLWLELPLEASAALEACERHVMGGIHAVEHAALSLFPLFALCDRHDVAGISYTRHPQLGKPAIFLYDAHPGGVGIATGLFDRVEALLESTDALIGECPCEDGCPGCVHSPKCSNGNRPIDKTAARELLALLLGRAPLPALPERGAGTSARAASAPGPGAALRIDAAAPRLVFFDLETRRSAEEVGGWHRADRMGLAVGVTYDTATDRYERFEEPDVPALRARLAAADLVVGFNVLRFDYAVLRGYGGPDPAALPTFDVLDDIHRRIGFRLPMGHLAEETLGVPKSADGLQSLAWWREGEVERVADYCRRDVEILRALFEHGAAHGHLSFRTKDGRRVRLPARWDAAELVEAARARQASRRGPRRGASSKSMRAVTGSASAITTATRAPTS